MPRYAKGVTLTPKEKAPPPPTDRGKISKHTFTVTLPNRATCEVIYHRSMNTHIFLFDAPLSVQRSTSAILSGNAEIEAKALQFATDAFDNLQVKEQKEKRTKAPSGNTATRPGKEPELSTTVAERLAGKYAICVKSTAGSLIRVGDPHEDPKLAQQEICDGTHGAIPLRNGQRLVVGICNRTAQRWEEPAFLGSNRPESSEEDEAEEEELEDHDWRLEGEYDD